METEPYLPTPLPIDPKAENIESSELALSPSRLLSQRPLVGAALLNLGNTCFMNAVLQCITHTVPLLEKLLSNSHNSTCSGKHEDFCSFCALRKHVNECIVKLGMVVVPRSFVSNLRKISSYFEPGEQQDAHEFLSYLLDSIHNSYLKPISKDKQPSFSEGDSPVYQVFGGRLRSQLRCSDCSYCSDTYEPLLDLSLEIDDADSLPGALESFTKTEKIDDPDAKFTCDGCKAQVSMEKQLKIDQPPTVIAFHLKRFKNIELLARKIFKFVNYPLELDLTPFLSCPKEDEQLLYDLYAIVVHNGSCYSGHYYCNVRTSPTTWHQMNDSNRWLISESVALDQEAYILFYIKKGSSPWFSTLMASDKFPQLYQGRDGSPSSVLDRDYNDHASSSAEEVCSSSPRQTTEKDEAPSPHACTPIFSTDEQQTDNLASACTSPEFPTDQLHANNPAHPPLSLEHLRNKSGAVVTPTGRFLTQPTKRPGSDHHIIDTLRDKPLEDDKENQLIPKNPVGSKDSQELGKRIINAVHNPQLSSLQKLIKHMPGSRRSSILACLNNSSEAVFKRPLTSDSDQSLKKRKIMTSDLHTIGGKGRPGSPDAKSLSPHSIRRGLFADDLDVLFEF